MDAGAGIEPTAPDNETGMLPLHHPAEWQNELHRNGVGIEQRNRAGRALRDSPERSHAKIFCNDIHGKEIAADALKSNTKYLKAIHVRCNTSNQIFQIVE